MAARSPQLIVVSAPSGAGKTTLCQRLLADFRDRLTLSISSTTRAPRGGEVEGQHYFFLSVPDFEQLIQDGMFAEWARVHDNYYGTSRAAIDGAFAAGKSVLLDIYVQGAASLALAYPAATLRIFVAPPSLADLESRLRARGTDREETIQKRMKNAAGEMARQHEFDKVIVNDQLDRAYLELRSAVEAVVG
jgi:guanylate kinase